MGNRKFFMVGVMVGLVLLLAVGSGAQQSECLVTVQAGQSLVAAIEAASPGAVLCLGPGIWQENVSIGKPLHIRGAGPQATFIKGIRDGPILWIGANVKLADLTITESSRKRFCYREECGIGIVVKGSGWATLHNVILAGHDIALLVQDTSYIELSQVTVIDSEIGLSAEGNARVSGSEVVISERGVIGIDMSDSAFVHLAKLMISHQEVGIQERHESHLRLSEARLLENRVGLEIHDGEAKLLDTVFEANWVGLQASDGVVMAERVTIARSQRDGLVAIGKAIVSLEASKITDNGVHPNCRWVAWVCNGLTVREITRVWITNSGIQGNTDWGLAAWKRECGYAQDLFEGQVTLLGTVQIEGNNKSGNHTGAGKPEGQVCLP